MSWREPATVTCCSCMACSSADWVRGLARLISSAIRSWPKIGPGMKRKARLPPTPSSRTSLPRMSEGIRSGVNWMRRASSPSTVPSASTSLVLARPGTPPRIPCPPHSTVISVRSTTSSWPKITAPMAVLAAAMCVEVVSAERTIMSSSFSTPSPPATAIMHSSIFYRFRSCQTDAPTIINASTILFRFLGPRSHISVETPLFFCISGVRRGLPLGLAIRVGTTMANERRANEGQTGALDGIASHARREGSKKGPPPVHLWNPPFCGDIDMRIATDGTWYYLKTPIGRPALVKLFASVLKREADKYFLVTPVEKCGITVDDAPFLAVETKIEQSDKGRVLNFRTNVDDWVACGPEHRLRFEPEPDTGGLKPYLHVRRDLWAKVTRALFYDLVELGEERELAGENMFGIVSGGEFFAMAPADSLKEFA